MSMTGGSGARIQTFQMQADALVNMSGGTPPVSGTKYEWSTDGSVANAIGTQKNVRIISVSVAVTWTVQPTPLEVHFTIDGIPITHSVANPTTSTAYQITLDPNSAMTNQMLLSQAGTSYHLIIPYRYEGRTVKVEAETTGGTVSALNMRVKWAKVV